MEVDLINQLRKEKKVQTNMTFKVSTRERIEKFKKKHKIVYLSPFVDLIICDWLDKKESEE